MGSQMNATEYATAESMIVDNLTNPLLGLSGSVGRIPRAPSRLSAPTANPGGVSPSRCRLCQPAMKLPSPSAWITIRRC